MSEKRKRLVGGMTSAFMGVSRKADADEQLIEALSDTGARQVALRSLLKRDPNRPLEPIVQAVRRAEHGHAPDPYVEPGARELFILGLDRLPMPRAFLAALSDPDPELRRKSAEALQHIADESCREWLEWTAEHDAEESVRRAANEALSKLNRRG